MEQLKEELDNARNELESTRTALKNVDEERDDVQSRLEAKQLEIEDLSKIDLREKVQASKHSNYHNHSLLTR